MLPLASAIDPRQRQRLLIEAQAAEQLHHPHIVPIFAAGCDQGILFYAIQYVEGHTLGKLLSEFRNEDADTGEDQSGYCFDDKRTAVKSFGACRLCSKRSASRRGWGRLGFASLSRLKASGD